jgi:hypothetical protein
MHEPLQVTPIPGSRLLVKDQPDAPLGTGLSPQIRNGKDQENNLKYEKQKDWSAFHDLM